VAKAVSAQQTFFYYFIQDNQGIALPTSFICAG